MLTISSLDDIQALRESFDVECKLAAGRDGAGALPRDFWPTYSAFANSNGGEVLLGLEEKKGRFRVNGIDRPQKVIDDLWSLLNDAQKVSANLLSEKHVQPVEIDGKTMIRIHVPPAQRKLKPVYVDGNPMTGTYRRRNSGDYRCDEETVRRMLAEQVEDSRDNELLKGYTLDDIEVDSFNDYRQMFAARQPDHLWNESTPQDFLRNVGAWKTDRELGFGALTRGGLLMFGRLPSIREAFPHYMLDYQERDEARSDARWIDRLTLDGSWSGNLFDFYRRVIRKLTADLKVPFAIKGDQRSDDTPVHEALREALVNALVHADYSDRASILVIKRPDMFSFRNPGLMRIPLEIAVLGGESDPRNRLLHQMFRFIGLGEQAGSGIPKIYQGWDSQHWRRPKLIEKEEPSDQTLLELPMLGLFPEPVVQRLREAFGSAFDELPKLEQLILATAAAEKTVTHRRMGEISIDHTHDLTMAFQHLCRMGLLESAGRTRATVYFLPDESFPMPEDSAFAVERMEKSKDPQPESENRSRAKAGWLIVKGLEYPLIDDLSLLDPNLRKAYTDRSSASRLKKKLPSDAMESIILQLCSRAFLTVQVLSELMQRKEKVLVQNYLRPMVRDNKLSMAFPTAPTDPKQAYASPD